MYAVNSEALPYSAPSDLAGGGWVPAGGPPVEKVAQPKERQLQASHRALCEDWICKSPAFERLRPRRGNYRRWRRCR